MSGFRQCGSVVLNAAVLLLSGAAGRAEAQTYRWRCFLLHNEAVPESVASALDVDMACGDMFGDAAIWPGRTSDYVSLRPMGASKAFVWAADDGTQGGVAVWPEIRPILWRGSADTFVDLVPDGPYKSGQALALAGQQVVGYSHSTDDGDTRAIVWSTEDPEQFVDLHPDWADWSDAYATDGTWQGGRVASTAHGGLHVGIWKGTPESWVTFAKPVGGNVFGMAPGTQVGYLVDGASRATVWHGTPESAVRLHPEGATSSRLYATTGDKHVGYADSPGESSHARIWWSDDPADNLDLHRFVPPEHEFASSVAKDISVVDGVVYIAGDVGGPGPRAFLWIGTPLDSAGPTKRKAPQHIDPRP